jgi:hypothetical protein
MNSNIDEYGNIGRLSVAHYKPTVTGAGATSNNLASATTVMYPTTNPMSVNFTTETINTYDNDSAKWHLGRLKTAEVHCLFWRQRFWFQSVLEHWWF